ncbi:hydrogenase formation HypD protein [Desulfurococcus amylolyticus 1221n]|uniref:Hydrogenase formation HypD protein n=1 Tax=Desulfurococcus amylolyticus (strain DSM 18924 / JCM 16383 / VKM B-2413 / 1221n) TaxID=490899 RepID=B8D4E4_DESA1|nr:hydrogenase formation protein HypD [Desulfurococcus amylolyticus]ACL10975.1 hydrogenase formation HypD protein [Desulfurococcus amylolyticus 1221n]
MYRSRDIAIQLSERIKELSKKILAETGRDELNIMNFCGTHEWTITHYGLRSLMPPSVNLVAGPGCPVCITPGYYIDILIDASFERNTVVLTYGDAFKLPGSRNKYPRSLFHAKANGGNVKVVYSFQDAVKEAVREPSKRHVFLAVGFETTMPATAIPLVSGKMPRNLYILSAYRLTPPIMRFLLEKHPEIRLDGIIAPGHVSAVIGANSWRFVAEEYGIPIVVSGFEPLDVVLSIYMILKNIEEGRPGLMNEYTRVVNPDGNTYAFKAISEAYTVKDSYWRGIGSVPLSGAVHSPRYSNHDYLESMGFKETITDDKHPGCICDKVVLGLAKPTQCPLFMKTCTPNNPYGPCMVSSEGTCRIWAENMPVLHGAVLQ